MHTYLWIFFSVFAFPMQCDEVTIIKLNSADYSTADEYGEVALQIKVCLLKIWRGKLCDTIKFNRKT